MPAVAVIFDAERGDGLTHEFRDGLRPEPMSRAIGLHNANLPPARKSPPDLMRDAASDAAPPIAANNEELCHIPAFVPSFYQNQSR